MKITGEYWITDSELWFADGDVGDTNHEGYALDHARRLFLDDIGADNDHEYMDDKTFVDSIHERLDEDEFRHEYHTGSVLKELLTKWRDLEGSPQFSLPLMGIAFDQGDTRAFAMEHWNWKWVKKMWVGTHTLTLDDFIIIAEGLLNAADQEGNEINPTAEVEIAVATTNLRYLIDWSDLENKNYDALGITPFIPEKCAAVENADKAIMHPHYAGKLGD